MGRYANRSIRLDFPDLSEDGDLIYVVIRNPKTMSADQLMPADVANGPDGEPEHDAAMTASYEVMAALVTEWHVYDGQAQDDSDPLGLPATGATLRSLPFEIVQAITDEIGKVLSPPT